MKTLFRYLLLFLLCFLGNFSFGQSWLWAYDGEGIGNNVSNAITVDGQGNTYMTGYIDGVASFQGTNYQGRGIYDIYIAKYDAQGTLQWVKLAGGDGNDVAYAIKYQNGNLYLAGSFEDTAYFESTQVISKGGTDAFIAKYDDNGNLVWVKSAGGANPDYASCLDVDAAGNVFVAGQYETAMTFGTTPISTTNIYNESFYAKYDNNGNLVWAKSTVGNNTDLITGIACGNNNSVYLTGFFSGSFSVDTGNVISQSPSYDIFLAKLDEGGSLRWIRKAGSAYDDEAKAICIDNNGNPVITGYYSGTAFFGNDSVTLDYYSDVFVAKYDTAGNNLWVRAGNGPVIDIGFAVTSDGNGNIFATGIYQLNINFGGKTATCQSRQLFAVSYDPYGNVRWLVAAGGTQTAAGLGIAVAPSGNVIVSGYYEYTCVFGATSLTIADASNLFIASYDPPAVNGISEIPDMEVKVYPNPASRSDVLSLVTSEPETSYEAYDLPGQLIQSGKITKEGKLNINGLVPGLYLFKFTTGDKNSTVKVVVE